MDMAVLKQNLINEQWNWVMIFMLQNIISILIFFQSLKKVKTGMLTQGKMCHYPYLTPYEKINFSRIIGLNMEHKMIQMLWVNKVEYSQ